MQIYQFYIMTLSLFIILKKVFDVLHLIFIYPRILFFRHFYLHNHHFHYTCNVALGIFHSNIESGLMGISIVAVILYVFKMIE